ncbi:sulfite exporter TauE/SafE family protein [Marinoscillum furvescens]|uniref:Probable membrane transporter protein n=1 Tax=Marinoscillum furvescens DSM 4134 TaxID=1122208 RepID=A0A3D9LFZ0_MARFU|nr:sulfite exporter TauE/SafE family protein [Marinoscillum furvescens]REE05548.1 hypothetical protein C7460_10164 [Marinoscillum furvescens DSM 4134]
MLWLLLTGAVAFSISVLTAGGGALMMVPILNWLIGVPNTAPVLNTGNLFGRPIKLWLFWKHIQWKAVCWYAPFALAGAILSGYLFSKTNLQLLQVVIGMFLVSTVFQYRWGKKKASFPMTYPMLAPLGLVVSIIGTLIGAVGPVLNPFFLNLNISKERLVATKTANSFLMGLAQIGSYTWFGLMGSYEWQLAIALGVGITIGNVVGKKILARITDQRFRQWAIAFMVISGSLMIIRSIQAFYF